MSEFEIIEPYGDNELAQEELLKTLLRSDYKVVAVWGGNRPHILLRKPFK